MATLNDLVGQIENDALRERIKEELRRVAKQKKFGLVFEEHMPECTPLWEIPIKRGSLVARKDGKMSDVWRVLAVVDGKAVCVKDGSLGDGILSTEARRRGEANAEGTEFNLADLVVVAKFGEPIYPYLKPLDTVANAPESDLWHTLIEADNYHALQFLEYVYAGKVDCIYIDPPYNTGAKDWKYNNDFVDDNDSYRHSKWLSMMQKRLALAKKLLNPRDSVLIVTIDEKEYLHLGCLLEEMFPETTITMAIDVINPRAGVARPGSFRRSHEYIFFLQFGESAVELELIDNANGKANPIWFSLMRTGSNSARSERPNLFYPIWVFPNGKLFAVGDNIARDLPKETVSPPVDGVVAIWPLRPDGRENCWQLGRDALSKAFKDGTAKVNCFNDRLSVAYLRNAEKERIAKGEIIVIGKDERGALVLRHNEGNLKTKAPDAVWSKASHDAGIYGSTLISELFQDRRFSFPKSLYAVHDALRFFVANKPDAIIVDFFAGSGTTLHAVNLLNAEDGAGGNA